MRVRLKFSKLGAVKFIGHLDIMRCFQKIFRQANIPLAYTGGFSPRQVFSIAAPLSVGVTSEGEYLDLELESPMVLSKIIEQVNACCPKGLVILSAIEIDDTEPAAMASVSASKYVIEQNGLVITTEQITEFAKQETIMIRKKSKKGTMSDLDIKPGIYSVTVKDTLDEHKIIMTLATGSVFNIKPDTFLQAFCDYLGVVYNPFDFKVHREELYHSDHKMISLSVPIKPVF